MVLTIVTPPASLAVLLLESVIEHLNAAAEMGESPEPAIADQGYILALTEAAVAMLDGPTGRLQRCLLEQTWKQTIDHAFPPIIGVTLPPIQSVESLKYRDDAGVLQTLDPAEYRVTGTGSWLTEIAPAYGLNWPSVRWQRETIELEFVSGYGRAAEDVPAPILQAIRMMVAHWFQNREAVNVGNITSEVPFGVRPLLASFRVFRGGNA